MSNSADSRINIRVTAEFKEKVTKYIRENNISLTDLVTQSIDKTMSDAKPNENSKISTLELLTKSLARNLESISEELQALKVKSQA